MSLSTNLVAYYKLDGNSTDSIGYINGTDTSISYSSSYGKINQGADFSTTSSMISFSNTTIIGGTADFTLNFWINRQSLISSGNDFIISRRSSYPENWEVFGNSSNNQISLNINGTQIFSTLVSAPIQTWTMVTYVRSGNSFLSYENGSLVQTVTNSINIPTGHTFTMGKCADGTTGMNNGYLDEVGIWSRALSSTEVSQLYNGGAGLQYPFTSASQPAFLLNFM